MEDEELIVLLQKGTGDGLHAFDLMGFAADRLEALRAERDAEKWRVDNWRKCFEQQQERAKKAEARAEKAEAEVARLREALQKILAEDDQPVCCGNGTYGDCANPPECCNQPIYGLDRAQSIARAALAPVEVKGGAL